MKQTYLILIRGLPKSGKTALAKVFADRGFHHFESDQYLAGNDAYRYSLDAMILAHTECRLNAETALMNERNVVVANVFATASEIQPYIELAIWRKAHLIIINTQGDNETDTTNDTNRKQLTTQWESIANEICLNNAQLRSPDIDAIVGHSNPQ